jgi:hypothetical protein
MGFSKTKPLQVETIKKQFFDFCYSQNSDLKGFECTKFVHITSLKNSGSKMIYKSRGIQGLQKYMYRTCRTKDINQMHKIGA